VKAVYRPAALLAIIAVGVAIRCADWRRVLGGAEVFFPDNDPYYHMRRVLMTMESFPHVPVFDHMMNYPFGAFVIWPPLLDFALAMAALAVGLTAADSQAVAAVCSVIIPIIGGLTAMAVYYLAEAAVGRRYSLAAAGIFIIFPAHIWYSKIGFVDHHAAVTLAQTAMFAIFLRLYQRLKSDGSDLGLWRSLALMAGGAISIAAGTLIWHGYIFFVAVLDAFLLAGLAADGLKKDSRLAELCWMTHIPAALMVLPFAVSISAASGKPFTAIMLSFFHAGALSILGLIGVGVSLARSRPGLFGWPWGAFIAAPLALLALAGLAQTGAVAEGLGWIMTSDKFMASVLESTSFFRERGGFSLVGPLYMLTGLFPVVVAGAAVMAHGQWKDGFKDSGKSFISLLTILFFLMLAKQRRFGPDFGPAQAVMAAYLAVNAVDWLKSRLAPMGAAPAMASAAVVAVILLSAAPFHMSNVINPALAQESGSPDHYLRKNQFLYKLRDIVKRDSPQGADEGAMAYWDNGHKILYITGLGAVSNNFGLHIGVDSYHDWCAFFLSAQEKDGNRILDNRKVRYVVADFDLGALYSAALYMGQNPSDYFRTVAGARVFTPRFYQTLFSRFSASMGSQAVVKNPGGEDMIIPPLEGFRLILDSEKDDQPGYLKAWEKVPGASLALRGEPSARLTVTYEYISNANRHRVYLKGVMLDEHGRGVMLAPYSSQRPDLGQTAKYRIAGQGSAVEIFVTEQNVLSGAALDVDLGRAQAQKEGAGSR